MPGIRFRHFGMAAMTVDPQWTVAQTCVVLWGGNPTAVRERARARKVSAELVVTLFSPGSPLHDGAVILREDSVIAASCILPLSANPHTPIALGTRHRAALGLSEETDAAIVVVSEESGGISVAFRGALHRNLSEGELRSELSRIFRIRPDDEDTGAAPTGTPGADRAQSAAS